MRGLRSTLPRLLVPALLLITLAIMVLGPTLMWQTYRQQLRHEAGSIANLVVAMRQWVASNKMVWVDSLDLLSPGYLIRREAGEFTYYGKNPAMVTREISDIFGGYHLDISFRVTSDNPRNPVNQPDQFDRNAIDAIRADESVTYFDAFENHTYRYAEPLWVTRSCLNCHGDPADAPIEMIEQYGDQRAFGYQLGDLRGVISVRIEAPPMIRFLFANWQGVLLLTLLGLLQLILIALLPWWRRH